MMSIESLPERGIYALLLRYEGGDIEIGALGKLHFPPGYYVYIGSSQNNLRKRIERHMRREKKLRWHIDYFVKNAKIVDIVAAELSKLWEERIALELQQRYEFIKNFGAGDSSARSHLFYSPSLEIWEFVKLLLRKLK